MSDLAERPEERPAGEARHREQALLEEEDACFLELSSQDIELTLRQHLRWLEESDPVAHRILMSFVVRLSMSEAKAKYLEDPVREFCRRAAVRLEIPQEEVKYKLKAGLLLLGDRIKKGAR